MNDRRSYDVRLETEAGQSVSPPWKEMFFLTLALGGITIGWVVSLGGGAVSTDLLNHHLYLGWQAISGSRLHWDHFAAGGMSCQYPLAYAPLYLMSNAEWPGALIFPLLSLAAIAAIPALWLSAWTLVPGTEKQAVLMRILGTTLACTGALWWQLLTHTANDLPSTVPAFWAVALAMLAGYAAYLRGNSTARAKLWATSGLLTGTAIALKLTQFTAFLMVVTLAVMARGTWRQKALAAGLMLGGATVGFVLLAGGWVWGALHHCGSPVYPLFVNLFQHLFFSGQP